jgi:hypothetical protein
MPPNLGPEAPDSRQAVAAIVRRALDMTPAERRRLGRWTSASLRDPRLARGLEAARDTALTALDGDPALRERWDRASRPLYDELVAATREVRRWRIWMLVSHLAALLAIVNVPSGLPPIVALLITMTAPASAWAAWGSGIGWLGAIHAALADTVADRLEPDDLARLRQAWQNGIVAEPPVSPPLLGAVNALGPSVLLVVALFVVVATSAR